MATATTYKEAATLRLVASTAPREQPESMALWLPPERDCLGALVINDFGGTALFAMDEELALPVLAAWWRVNRQRYLQAQEAERVRLLLRAVGGGA